MQNDAGTCVSGWHTSDTAGSPDVPADRTLEALLMRVKGAVGPDRELDADIAEALDRPALRIVGDDKVRRAASPRYTSSVDDVWLLVRLKMPNWQVNLYMHDGSCSAEFGPRSQFDANAKTYVTPAIALLAALLTALVQSRSPSLAGGE